VRAAARVAVLHRRAARVLRPGLVSGCRAPTGRARAGFAS
jgi:hypothetical protein